MSTDIRAAAGQDGVLEKPLKAPVLMPGCAKRSRFMVALPLNGGPSNSGQIPPSCSSTFSSPDISDMEIPKDSLMSPLVTLVTIASPGSQCFTVSKHVPAGCISFLTALPMMGTLTPPLTSQSAAKSRLHHLTKCYWPREAKKREL